jgi:crotonobetainyl-CoA:carnitine CoA-transferase CaiB-like acyl-CoA transferase
VIYCSLSGYGQDGPYRDWIAYGMGLEPASGISQLTGYAGEGPMRSGISLTDPLSGLAAAVAVLIALRHRRRTGEGQYIDLSEHEAAIPLVAGALLDQQMNGREPERRGNRSWFAAPQGVYPCAGNRQQATGNRDEPESIPHSAFRIPHSDEWLAISCHTDAEFAALCDAVGHPEWKDDERFADLPARHANHDALDELIAGWTRGMEKIAAMEHLQRAGVRAGAVLHGKDLLLTPHLRDRGHFDIIDHPDVGRRPIPRQTPVHFSKFDTAPRRPAPRLGEHNDDVLTALAGLTADDLTRLREEKVIGNRPEPMLPVELVQGVAQWPLDVLIEAGAIKQVDADYREQLMAFGYELDADQRRA